MQENFQKIYLACLVDLYKHKKFKSIQENIQRFISKLSPSTPELRKKLTCFFLLLVPIPISRGISSFEKPPTQLVLETIPLFSFLLSRGKLNLQAGKEGICFEMPLMRTVRECLVLLSRNRIPARSKRIFEENLVRFCDFFKFFYDKKIVGEIIAVIKEASTLIGLLLAGEKKYRDVKPDDLKLAFHSLRSILFKIPSVDWVVIEKLSRFQQRSLLNGLMQGSTFSATQEQKLRTYFYQQLRKNPQRFFLNAPEESQPSNDFLFKSFVDFLGIQKWKLKRKNITDTPIDHYFAEFQRTCKQSSGIACSEAFPSIPEVNTSREAYKLLKALKNRVIEYIQLTKEPQSFLSYKYEYSTFIEHQRTLIVFFSQLKSLNRPGSKIGRKEILRGFIDWVDLVSEDRVNTDMQHQQSIN